VTRGEAKDVAIKGKRRIDPVDGDADVGNASE